MNSPKSDYVSGVRANDTNVPVPQGGLIARGWNLASLHSPLAFYFTEVLHYFSTCTCILPEKFSVFHTKLTRNGLSWVLLLSLNWLQGPKSPLSSASANRWVLLGSPAGCALCLQGLPLAFGPRGGHLWALVSLVCQAKL